jgi:hypothetical protein
VCDAVVVEPKHLRNDGDDNVFDTH